MPIYTALRYRDAGAAIEWLERAFGCETIARHDNPDGTVAHAELRLGDDLFMLGSGGPGLQDFPANFREARVTIYVGLGEVEALHARAKAAGVDVGDLIDQDYGSRDFQARDLEGIHWSFGTYAPQAAAASPDSA